MNESIVKKQSQGLKFGRWSRIALPIILLLIIGGAMLAYPLTSARQVKSELPDTKLIEELYGIRIKWIAVVFGGGGVDFRFIVVNPDKANEFMHDPAFLPVLIAEDSGKRIDPPQVSHDNMVFRAGTGYHIMYSNPGGVIKSGTPVTVEFNEFQIEGITAN